MEKFCPSNDVHKLIHILSVKMLFKSIRHSCQLIFLLNFLFSYFLFDSNEDLRNRYQRASDHFCQTHLDLPTPVITNNPLMKSKQSSWSSSSSNSSFERTRTTRHSSY